MATDALTQYQHQLQEQFAGGALIRLLLMSVVMVAVGSPVMVVLHELGHALAARRRGLHVPVVRLGKTPLLDLELAAVRFELGWWLWMRWREPVRPGTDALGSDPDDVLHVALAGPAVSLGIGLIAQALTTVTPSGGDLNTLLQLIALSGIGATVWSLIPRTGSRGDSDGRRALDAISRRRSAA
jgi:Zn-dependent protease